MVYDAEAVMPNDLEHDSPRVVNYAEADIELARQEKVDQLDEARDLARPAPPLPARTLPLPKSPSSDSHLPGRRPGPATDPGQEGHAQALSPVGGTIHHRECTGQQRLLPHRRPR